MEFLGIERAQEIFNIEDTEGTDKSRSAESKSECQSATKLLLARRQAWEFRIERLILAGETLRRESE
jgi:hypothetical protein